MIVTPEIVRAEMDYRVEQALASAARRRAPAPRTHRTWLGRLRERLEAGGPTAVNGAPRAA
ncbi:MAG TPA: hypothetical protein VGP26_20430 [Actinophytocola sp.]|jgi:hypothetical protein|nr:hypothetical protein [Actinophytocola sp.]